MNKRRVPPHFIPPLFPPNEFHPQHSTVSPTSSLTSSFPATPSSFNTFRTYPNESKFGTTPLSIQKNLSTLKDSLQNVWDPHVAVHPEDSIPSFSSPNKTLQPDAYTSLRRMPQLAKLPRSLGPPGDMETEIRRIKVQQCKLYSNQLRIEWKAKQARKQLRK
ncbi:hypothetical protein HMI54_004788 [Coelomomyces lativittatus]|nr:hypothetical protein HMI56_003427 [Coelomomyces lativittatus]KAJ1506805.1 hypothetical protein HMI54_004788 [Coelomomyces lativittatus]KAJ1508116.1 hypothetical protein HMI55_000508 [Coelomomyces lativittatus]